MLKALSLSLLTLMFASSLWAAPQCKTLFYAPIAVKNEVIEAALLRSGVEKPSSEKLKRIIKKWNIERSTPFRAEVLATQLVSAKDSKSTFLTWLRELTLGESSQKLFQARYNILNLKEAIETELQRRNLLKKSSKLDSAREFKRKHDNKYKLAKLVVINYFSIKYLSYPLYFPTFDLISSIQLSKNDLELIKKIGFKKAYKHFAEKFKWSFRVHQTLDKYPQAIVFTILAQLTYIQINEYMEEKRYMVPETIITIDSLAYEVWARGFQELEGRVPDIKNNPKDLENWEFTRNVLYRVWVDEFQQAFGRPLDLSRLEDREWLARQLSS